jgi:hypothetical protein
LQLPAIGEGRAEGLGLLEATALLAANFGAARENASQLEHLERAVAVAGKEN